MVQRSFGKELAKFSIGYDTRMSYDPFRPRRRPEQLRVPDFTERLLLAADQAQLSAAQLRDRLREIGVPVGDKSMYKMFDGTVRSTNTRTLAGLAAVLGTDVRWFCEPDDSGELYRALVAYWAGQRAPKDAEQGPAGDHHA